MKQDELKLVLEALKWCHGGEPCGTAEAIVVIEKTLAQLEPWCMKMNGCKTKCEDCPDEPPDICCQQYDTCLKPCTPRGVHLAQRTWVGLTGEEAMDVTRKEGHELLDFIYEYGTGVEGVEERIVVICKAIEDKLKQKNGYAEEEKT